MNRFSTIKYVGAIAMTAVLFSACKKSPSSMTITSDSSDAEIASQSQKIAAAMEAGTPLSCTITSENVAESYTYVVQEKKFRMTNTTTSEEDGSPILTNVLSDGEFAYTWTEPENQGMKFKMPTEEDMKESVEKAENAQESLENLPDFSSQEKIDQYEDEGYTISCEETTVSADTFTPPSTVTFQDLSTIMDSAVNESMQGVSEEQRQEILDAMKQYQQ